uniref:Uncharacterized protein n=1 Tax=Parascaris univalens TaxID=6257 RepID=A0A915A7F9_PARUN
MPLSALIQTLIPQADSASSISYRYRPSESSEHPVNQALRKLICGALVPTNETLCSSCFKNFAYFYPLLRLTLIQRNSVSTIGPPTFSSKLTTMRLLPSA